jgi:hypothetical protein
MKKYLLLVFSLASILSYSQGITGVTTTEDKYSKAIAKMTSEYESNQYTTFDEIYTNETVFIINGNNFSKEQVKQAYMAHHNLLYTDIALPWSFTETTVYDENNNNQVWSHFYTNWTGKVKRNGEEATIPVFASFKWVDGKVVTSSWIYDPTIEMREMKKAGLLK